MSDGATESIFSDRWAKALVQRWVEDAHSLAWDGEWLSSSARSFRASYDFTALPWHAQEKASLGSFATLIGLKIDLQEGQWSARAVGDSILVLINPTGEVTVVPSKYQSAQAFDNSPVLIGSNPEANGALQVHTTNFSGMLQHGTSIFMLMTDALAQWVVQSLQSREPISSLLVDTMTEEAFTELVQHLRDSKCMRNDDVAIVAITLNFEAEVGNAISHNERLSTRDSISDERF